MPRKVRPERADHIKDWCGGVLGKKVIDFLVPGCIVRVMYSTDLDPHFPPPEGKHDLVYVEIYKIKDGSYWGKLVTQCNPCPCTDQFTCSDFREYCEAYEDRPDDYLGDLVHYRTTSRKERMRIARDQRNYAEHVKHDEVCPLSIIRPSMNVTFRKEHVVEVPTGWQPAPVRKAMARAGMM